MNINAAIAQDVLVMRLRNFGKNRLCRALAGARFAKLGSNLVEFQSHPLPRWLIIAQMIDGSRAIFRPSPMLDELGNNFFIGEDIWHSEIVHFHQKPAGDVSDPRNFIDENEWHPKISRLQSRA